MHTIENTNLSEFDSHKFVGFIHDSNTGLNGYIAIHRGDSNRPSFGATRMWNYESQKDALKDALKLSRTMSYKAAMAGIKCGGAKAVIVGNGKSKKDRVALLKSYAERINYLGGNFITGADVGISRDDVIVMRRASPYFVGTKTEPVKYTALGLLYSIHTCLKEINGSPELTDRSFAIQGIGKVGEEMLRLIYPHSKKIYISDIDDKKLSAAKRNYPKVKITGIDEIYSKSVDIFCPCALSNCLNHKNISNLKCKVVVGGANNQLENNSIGDLLYKIGILYAPDYIVNAGGLISVYDEYENGNYRTKRVKKKVKGIADTLEKVIKESKNKKISTNESADKIAEQEFNDY